MNLNPLSLKTLTQYLNFGNLAESVIRRAAKGKASRFYFQVKNWEQLSSNFLKGSFDFSVTPESSVIPIWDYMKLISVLPL